MLLLVLGEVSEISQQECLHYGQYLFVPSLAHKIHSIGEYSQNQDSHHEDFFFKDSIVNHTLSARPQLTPGVKG